MTGTSNASSGLFLDGNTSVVLGVSGGGNSGGGIGTAIAYAVAGIDGISLVGATGWLWYDASHGWILESAQPLTVEADDPIAWTRSTLDFVRVAAGQQRAVVHLQTASGLIDHRLPLKNRTGLVDHFEYSDPATRSYSTLSFNIESREYFFEEHGASGGRPYTLKAHGWLTTQAGSLLSQRYSHKFNWLASFGRFRSSTDNVSN